MTLFEDLFSAGMRDKEWTSRGCGRYASLKEGHGLDLQLVLVWCVDCEKREKGKNWIAMSGATLDSPYPSRLPQLEQPISLNWRLPFAGPSMQTR